MRISLICPSSIKKDKEIIAICDDYSRRIQCPVDIIEASAKTKNNDTAEQVKSKQSTAIFETLKKLNQNTAIIAMDERGKQLSSPDFAKKLSQFNVQGYSDIAIIIGGAFGLDKTIVDRADLVLSLGTMVWPHRLVAPMLMEQLYRAQQINAGHPYHKE